MPKMHIFRDIACSKPNTLNRSSLALRSEASSASSQQFSNSGDVIPYLCKTLNLYKLKTSSIIYPEKLYDYISKCAL